MPSKVIIIDYGSQVTQLIARRVREAGVYSEIHPCVVTAAQVKAMQPSAIILSGGPASVGEKDAPALDKGFLDLGVPVLGICYGMQLLAFNLGGGLEQSETREYGPADLRFVRSCALWDGIDLTKLSRVWMSHGDTVKTPPAGFLVTGSTDTLEVAAMADEARKIYAVQFHPEVHHSVDGDTMLRNFLFKIAKITPDWTMSSFVERVINEVRETVGDGHVVFGNGLIDKFRFADGQTVSLYDKYEDETREIAYEGGAYTWGTKSDMAVYMSLDDFNRFFGNDAGYFNGYASDQALDLDARYLTSDLTPESMDAIGEQFVGMMDDMIGMLVGLSVFIFLVFMYLLTKSVIDRSARAISYMKVFGYRGSEISRLYVRSITLTVAVSLVVCQPLIIGGLTLLFRAMLLAYNGNIEIYVPMAAIAEVIAIGFATYLAVALLHIRRIKRVPLALALKVQE